MKITIQYTAVCFLAACITFSCKKQELFDKTGGKTFGNISKITGVISQADGGYAFYYNSYGDPVAIWNIGNQSATGAEFFFLYDEKRNLSNFYSVYDNGGNPSFRFYHKYQSDEQNRIVVDSTFSYGLVEGGLPVEAQSVVVYYYEYDALNRISRVYTKDNGGKKHTTATYKYDSNGNRTDISKTFDDKVNIHRANKIWQFIDRDYSQNNPLGVQSYGSYTYAGLPEQLQPSRSASYHFVVFDYYLLNVVYTNQ